MNNTKIIAIYNYKGGVGKTTTTKMLARYFSKQKKTVLMIDMDPQGNLSSQYNVVNSIDNNNTIYHLIMTDIDSEKCIHSVDNNISIISATTELGKAHNEMLLNINVVASLRLKKQINQIISEFEIRGKNIDYILIDCPPVINNLLITNALTCADEVLIPISADSYAIDGISGVLSEVENIKKGHNENLLIKSMFINMYQNTNLHKRMYEELCDLSFFNKHTISNYVIIKEDTFSNNVSTERLDNHTVSKQYKELFDSIFTEE